MTCGAGAEGGELVVRPLALEEHLVVCIEVLKVLMIDQLDIIEGCRCSRQLKTQRVWRLGGREGWDGKR